VQPSVARVHEIVSAVEPWDDVEAAQRADILDWLASEDDVFRRSRPATPPRHLVSYAVLASPRDGIVFLVDHRLAGLWLPAGGHVEPQEAPAVTAAREAREELGIEADFSIVGQRPVLVTSTRTTGPDSHTDVSLWYLLAGDPGMPIVLDPREFAGGRWWRRPELEAAEPALFDPHMGRFLAKLRDATFRGQPRA
jgi:8-oxo-dGTP diphosphatase